jgi:type I restriction enzyme S subunit
MAHDWVVTRLGDHISLRGGLSYKGKFVDKGDALLIGMGCVSHSERFLPKGGRRYGGDFTEAHLVRPGDLVIATRQQSDNLPILGFPAMIPEDLSGRDVIAATNLYKVTNQSNISNSFLYWLMRGPAYRERILACAKGTTVRMLTKDAIEDFRFICPPKAQREAISQALDALDEKIDLNRRMNATLEAMARALFQSWFVDFDPVRAKLDGHQPVGLDKATAALFPDSFQDSELGPVPKGWEVKRLGEVVELAYGKPLKAEDRKTGPICVYGANGPVGWHDEKLVSGPGIVVGRKGNPGVVTWAHGGFYPIDTTFYVEQKGDCRSLYFLFYALTNHDLANLSADSAVPGLNRNHAYMSTQVFPPARLVEVFDKQAAPIFDAINANETQSRAIATLRDTLLPKLLSGEIRVSKAESLAEKAA